MINSGFRGREQAGSTIAGLLQPRVSGLLRHSNQGERRQPTGNCDHGCTVECGIVERDGESVEPLHPLRDCQKRNLASGEANVLNSGPGIWTTIAWNDVALTSGGISCAFPAGRASVSI